MSPGGQRARLARIAAKSKKGRLGGNSRLRFRGLAWRDGPGRCRAGPPLPCPAARGSPHSWQIVRAAALPSAGTTKLCKLTRRLSRRDRTRSCSVRSPLFKFAYRASMCGYVWIVNGQKTMQNRKCTPTDFGALVTFILQVGRPGLFSAEPPQQGRSRMDRMRSSSLGWA